MSQNINLKEFRGEAVRAYLQDGLVELSAGIVFAWWAAAFFADLFFDSKMTGFCWLPWILITFTLPAAKKRFTYPRIGRVEVVFQRERKLMVLLVAGVIALAGTLLLGIVVFMAPQDQVRPLLRPILDAVWSNLSAIMGIVLAGILLFLAVWYRVTRYYAFALISLISGFAFLLIDFDQWATDPAMSWASYFAVMGVVLMLSGLILFIRLLRERPLPAGGVDEPNG